MLVLVLVLAPSGVRLFIAAVIPLYSHPLKYKTHACVTPTNPNGIKPRSQRHGIQTGAGWVHRAAAARRTRRRAGRRGRPRDRRLLEGVLRVLDGEAGAASGAGPRGGPGLRAVDLPGGGAAAAAARGRPVRESGETFGCCSRRRRDFYRCCCWCCCWFWLRQEVRPTLVAKRARCMACKVPWQDGGGVRATLSTNIRAGRKSFTQGRCVSGHPSCNKHAGARHPGSRLRLRYVEIHFLPSVSLFICRSRSCNLTHETPAGCKRYC